MQTRLVVGISCVASMLIVKGADAADRGVEAANYDVSLAGSYADLKVGDGITKSGAIGSRFTLPLGHSLGVRLAPGYQRSTTDYDLVGGGKQSIASATAGLNAGLFYRNPDLFSFNLNFGLDRDRVSYSAINVGSYFFPAHKFTQVTQDRDVGIEGYFSSITVAAGWSSVHFDNGGSYKVGNIGTSWYATPDLRLGARVSFQSDVNNKDLRAYSTGLEFQPQLFQQRVSVGLDYVWSEKYYSAVGVALKYNFGTRVDLIARDRRYR